MGAQAGQSARLVALALSFFLLEEVGTGEGSLTGIHPLHPP